MSDDIVLAFSYCCTHQKSTGGVVDPFDHALMLATAIEWNNHQGLPAIVAATACDGHQVPPEAKPIWQSRILPRAAFHAVCGHNPGHYFGAMEALRAAFHWAAGRGARYLVMLADDVLLFRPDLPALARRLTDSKAAYLGSHWETRRQINTQVFCAEVEPVMPIFDQPWPLMPGRILEDHIFELLTQSGLPFLHDGPYPREGYVHAHRLGDLVMGALAIGGRLQPPHSEDS